LILSFGHFLSFGGVKFSYEILKSPIENSDILLAGFSYNEIGRYNNDKRQNYLFIENGYASHQLKFDEELKEMLKLVKIEKISIVYTKYPFSNEDWITNYYELLANRLLDLFELDASLNNDKIEWNLIAQTNCKTAKQAKEFLHGIEIIYSLVMEKEELKDVTKNDVVVPVSKVVIDEYKSYTSDKSLLEHQKLMEEEKKLFPKKEKKNKMKEPECPDFKQKKRFRLFKRRN